jgi:hypothetical protein
MHTFSRRAFLAGFAPLIALRSLDAQGRAISAIAAPAPISSTIGDSIQRA